MFFIPLFLKCQHNWDVISSYPSPSVCLKNSENDIFPEPKIDRWVGLLLPFGKIKSRGYHAFLKIKLVGFDLNLIALGVICNFSHPLPGQFHYCFTQRGVLWDIHNGWQSENNNPRKRAKTESEAGHFMDYKENKLYHFIQLELLRLKNLTKIFGEEQSPRY